MMIDLTRPGKFPLEFDIQIPGDEIDLDTEGVKLAGDVREKGTVTRHIVETRVEGDINARIEVDCTRCLKPVETVLDIPFSVSYTAPENYTDEKETELHPGDLDLAVSEDDRIDLKEVAREQILLNLPEQVLCGEDCKGWCEKCGADRNLINCKCDGKETDPRWAALKDLIK
jgi:uncharacterized protein